ncbi:DoxX family protein [Rhodococcus sp. NPDC058521]|uniref:DoxX family protein n=1 Tax=Rhodococcus sp. NPDC058521 TaxID=3346536 RepID=UPI003650B5E8
MAPSMFRKDRVARDVLAPLLLRSLIGGTMIAHGVKHGRSLDGTAKWFESIGFRRPHLQARASAVVESAAGAALVAGFATPAAASAVVATMAVAGRSVHLPNGFFITSEGWEYVANLAAAATALAALGPGRISVDRLLGWDSKLNGDRAASSVLVVGLGAAAAQLALFHRPVPR